MTQTRLLVTGAASGIGRAVAQRALNEGAQVAMADRNGAGLREVWGTDALTLEIDVTHAESVAQAFAATREFWGAPPTAVVNAAGVYAVQPATSIERSDWDSVLATNVTGSMLVSQAAAREWLSAGLGGSIVLVASIAADRGDRDEPGAHYAASKGAVVSLCRQLAVEWGPHGIRVNAVSPGVIDTPMLRIGDDPDRLATYLASGVPLGRLGRADEVAEVCWFLAGERASYVSGAVISVDGGAGAA